MPKSSDFSARRLPACAGLALALLAAPALGQAATLTTLYAFTGSADGYAPYGKLATDSLGNLYGTTQAGGTSNLGTVFRIAPDGTQTVLHAFAGGSDGSAPYDGVIIDEFGTFYGTTYSGGAYDKGTVFSLAPDGTETILHSFGARGDGAFPYASLVRDKTNLWGTTSKGGSGGGTIYNITTSGVYTLLHALVSSEGTDPQARLLRGGTGLLYGTAAQGGAGAAGTVFVYQPSGKVTVLHAFGALGADAADPLGGLIADAAGNLYGTTTKGGATGASGNGAVFRVAPDGTETILHSFTLPDGTRPSCDLVFDAKGNLYGTTQKGGPSGLGTIFEIAPDGTETVLHAFDGTDGNEPYAGLVLDKAGNLYGTTLFFRPGGSGTVFKLAP